MQDKAFVQIGKIELEKMGNKEPYQLFIQNMFPEKRNYKMIVAVFELKTVSDQLSCSYRNIDVENVSNLNYEKYAYRRGSASGGNVTFTTKFSITKEEDYDKKLNNTLLNKQFKRLIPLLKTSALSNEYLIFNTVYKYLLQKENYNRLKLELSNLFESLLKEDKLSSGFSLMFIVDGEEKYLSDFQIFQQILIGSGTEEKSEKYDVKSEGLDAFCSVCLQRKPKVHGFASPFKYATVDKPGMVSGFFKQSNNWKNYPVCTDCSLEFELGRTYVTNNLSSYFYKKAYYTIPKTILSNDLQSLRKAVGRLEELYTDFSKGQKIKFQEDGLQKMIAEEQDYFNLNLLFYERDPKTEAIKIKLMLEEIVPSRFRKLFVDVPNKINTNSLYQNSYTEKKEPKNLQFSFGLLKTFFENNFYDLIRKVFLLQPISTESLYAKFMEVIRANYNRMQASDGYVEMTYLTILKAHLTIYYLQELHLIDQNLNYQFMSEIKPSENKSGFDPEKIKTFIVENKSLLDKNGKVGVFLLGAFVKHVLNVQHHELSGGTPFEKKLKGYSLSPTDLQTIYTDAYGKLKQYDSLPINLMDVLSEYFVLNYSEIQKMSNNEASFYFVAGLQFSDKLKYPKQNSNN